MPHGQPNIILIITDQQRYDTIAALGFPHMETPNLDRLVTEGVSFNDCHVTAASCVPARASLFSGVYPHTSGVLNNADPWRRSWVELLATAGYHCVNVGKMHSVPFETPLGFHERYVVENKDRYLQGRYYFDEWDKALAAHGLVKQQRELYRQRDDYRDRWGPFSGSFRPTSTPTISSATPRSGGSIDIRSARRCFSRSDFPARTRRTTRRRTRPRPICTKSCRFARSRRPTWMRNPRRTSTCGSTTPRPITIRWCTLSSPRRSSVGASGRTTSRTFR